MELNTYCLYKHISPSGKVYIGITHHSNPELRWKYGWGYSRKLIFGKAITKYGWNNFKHIIIFKNLNKTLAEKLEIKLIYFYKNILKISYNDANGGNYSGKMSDETKKKISLINKGHKYNIGKTCSDETKMKIGLANKNKKRTNEEILNLKTHKNIVGNTNRRKTLYQFDLNDNLINIFLTSYEAQKLTGINRCNISACCNNKIPHSGGYKWKYNYGN